MIQIARPAAGSGRLFAHVLPSLLKGCAMVQGEENIPSVVVPAFHPVPDCIRSMSLRRTARDKRDNVGPSLECARTGA